MALSQLKPSEQGGTHDPHSFNPGPGFRVFNNSRSLRDHTGWRQFLLNFGKTNMKLGTQLGQKAKAVLECLRKNGKLNRLDLEMKLNIGPLAKTINGMYAMHYIKQFGGQAGMYEITKMGRVALGENLALNEVVSTRICNGSMREVYVPNVHLTQRYGVARV